MSKTHRVPALMSVRDDRPVERKTATRQLDAALMKSGFKLSADLFSYLERTPLGDYDIMASVLDAVAEMLGDHVQHNSYFIDFPHNIPDTEEFWIKCVVDAFRDPDLAPGLAHSILKNGTINLLDLPAYGGYQHTYQEMLARHGEFVGMLKGSRLNILHLGGPLWDECQKIYNNIAGSTVPLNESDTKLLAQLACRGFDDPDVFPMRENKAVVNSIRLSEGKDIKVDTVTDVLRLAAAMSGGDATLTNRTKFKSFRRPERRKLLHGLEHVLTDEWKVGDVLLHREAWKRLGERLHPHEFRGNEIVRNMFAIARGDMGFISWAGHVEALLGFRSLEALPLLEQRPGTLWRSLDRLLRIACGNAEREQMILQSASNTVSDVSTRVLFGVWEHLINRVEPGKPKRIFVNKNGKSWVTDDERGPISAQVANDVIHLVQNEIRARLLSNAVHGIIMPDKSRGIAIPLTQKGKSDGFGVMPRGSVVPVNGNHLRFFVYWKEKSQRTDYDLSALLWDGDEKYSHLSWTQLSAAGGVHSGDITSAPNGASEFIDLDLDKVAAQGWKYIIPQINVFAGESFDDVEEAFFGFMELDRDSKGKPFEPLAVRVKSKLSGSHKVALPAAFYYDGTSWNCKWMDLGLKGMASMNRVEGNRVSTQLLIRSVLDKRYLSVYDLSTVMTGLSDPNFWFSHDDEPRPSNIESDHVISAQNLSEFIALLG